MTRRQWVVVAGAVVVSCGGAALGYRAMREAPRMSSCIEDFRLAHDATCLLLQNGRVHCFGNPRKIGKELVWDPDTEVLEDPEPYPVQTEVRFSAIDVGPYVACGLRREDGSVWCWGAHMGHRPHGVYPVEYPELGKGNVALASVAERVCVIGQENAVACLTYDGELLERLVEDAVEIEGSTWSACARTRQGEVWCWGSNDVGELGRGTTKEGRLGEWTEEPGPVQGLPPDVESVRVLGQTTCAITKEKQVWCWGSMNNSLLGDGFRWIEESGEPFPPQTLPVRLDLPPVRDFSIGHCFIAEDGSVWCWGTQADNRQLTKKIDVLPDGYAAIHPRPRRLEELGTDNVRIRIAGHVCVQKTDGSVWCWGNNYDGQITRHTGPEDGDTWVGLTRMKVNCDD